MREKNEKKKVGLQEPDLRWKEKKYPNLSSRLEPAKTADEAEETGGDKEDDGAEDGPEDSGDGGFAAAMEHGPQTATSQRLGTDNDAKALADLGEYGRDTVQARIHRTRTDVGHINAVLP